MCEKYESVITSLVGEYENESDCYHLGKVLLKTLDKYSNHIHQIDEVTGESETNGSVLRRSIQVAIWLMKRGIKTGDVILLTGANHVDLCIPFIAAFYIGAIVLPIDKCLNNMTIKHLMEVTVPKMIFCDPDTILTEIETILNELNVQTKIVVFGESNGKHESFKNILRNTENEIEDFKPVDLDPKTAPALIICSSGTTGMPKGILLSHKTVIFGQFDVWSKDTYPYTSEVIMALSQLHWYTAVIAILTTCIFGATRVQSSKPFSPDTAFRIMNKYKATMTVLNPLATTALLSNPNSSSADWSSLKYYAIGGGTLTTNIVSDLQEKLVNGSVYFAYAMTEIGGIICKQKIEHKPTKIAVGKLEPMIQAKIVDTQGNQLGINERGELLIKSEFMFLGYYKKEEETRKAFTNGGWFKTGDMLYLGEDGLYYFVDRVQMMISYKGHQISPIEIEDLIKVHESIVMVVVDKIENPSSGDDDLPVALVVKKSDAIVTAQEIRDFIADKLPFKELHVGVAFVEKLPLTATQKIFRKAVKEIVQSTKFQ